jgi:hypothetical protein
VKEVFRRFTTDKLLVLKLKFGFVLVIHGLVHLMGFAKAFYPGFQHDQEGGITPEITKPAGLTWFFTSLLFLAAALLLLVENNYWWFVALTADNVSQLLIRKVWRDAWPGTVTNLIVPARILNLN